MDGMDPMGTNRKDYRIDRLRTFERYFSRFPQTRILVVGDIILDHYLWGKVNRISPEAPVPIVHVQSETFQLGGAANVLNNIRALGGQAELCGVVGDDENGRRLLQALNIDAQGRRGLLVDRSRPTTRKTRLIAHNQQVVRFDIEERTALAPRLEKHLLRHIASRIGQTSCIAVSDYAKGTMTDTLLSELIRLAASYGIPLVVDPKVEHLMSYKGATVITPNHLEACHGAGLHSHDEEAINQAGELLRQRLGCQGVLITRGEHGMSLYEHQASCWHVPATARQVYDVTGAGDTVVGALALAIGAGASLREAAFLSNQAAGLVVGRVGTATVSVQELRGTFRS